MLETFSSTNFVEICLINAMSPLYVPPRRFTLPGRLGQARRDVDIIKYGIVSQAVALYAPTSGVEKKTTGDYTVTTNTVGLEV